MSETLTLVTNGAKLLKEGENSKGKWRLFGLLDEYDEVWGTWFNDAIMLREIKDAAGGEITVEFELDEDERRKIKSVGEPVRNGSEPSKVAAAPVGAGTLPETAWLCAAQMAKADLGFDAAKHLADRILADLKLKYGIDPDDFPF